MNASSVRAFAERAGLVREAIWPGTAVIGGQQVACALGDPAVTDGVRGGGLDLGGELVLCVRKAVLAEAPARGAVVAARGMKWVVETVTGHGAAEEAWVVRCAPHN